MTGIHRAKPGACPEWAYDGMSGAGNRAAP
jgi:hypothetical protein